MTRTTIAGFAALMTFFAAAPARATSGTCTISRAVCINNLDLPFQVPVADGLSMPVEFDEAAGTFSMSRDAWAAAFGATGASFRTVGDVLGFYVMDAGSVTGTIDSSGNVVLPHFASAFATDYCPPRSPNYPIAPAMTTGTQLYVMSGAVESTEGAPVAAAGSVTLEGLDVIPDACGAGSPILSGLHLSCVLSPVPNLAAAPPGPSFAKLSAKAKLGKALPTTPLTKPDKGDLLTLKARIAPGVATLDFAMPVFLRITSGGQDLVVLRVPAGRFAVRGTSASFVDKPAGKGGDPDGAILEAIRGRKENDANQSAIGGTIKTKGRKGNIDLAARIQGLDLSGLQSSAEMLVLVGSYPVKADVTVSGGGSSRKLK